MSDSPLALSVSPAQVTLSRGVQNWTGEARIANAGTKAITVTTSARTMKASGGSCTATTPPKWLTVSPSGTLHLLPGQSRTVAIHVHAPAGTNATVAAVFAATGEGTGNIHVTGAVASEVVINDGEGVTAHCGHAPKAIPPVHGNGIGFEWVLAGCILGIIAVIAVAVVSIRNQRKHRAFIKTARISAYIDDQPDPIIPPQNPPDFSYWK